MGQSSLRFRKSILWYRIYRTIHTVWTHGNIKLIDPFDSKVKVKNFMFP